MFGRKRMTEGNPQKVLNQRLPVTAQRIVATRALYQGEGIERIEMAIETPQGDHVVIELTVRQAHELISQLSVAYSAIVPPLPGSSRFQP